MYNVFCIIETYFIKMITSIKIEFLFGKIKWTGSTYLSNLNFFIIYTMKVIRWFLSVLFFCRYSTFNLNFKSISMDAVAVLKKKGLLQKCTNIGNDDNNNNKNCYLKKWISEKTRKKITRDSFHPFFSSDLIFPNINKTLDFDNSYFGSNNKNSLFKIDISVNGPSQITTNLSS